MLLLNSQEERKASNPNLDFPIMHRTRIEDDSVPVAPNHNIDILGFINAKSDREAKIQSEKKLF